MKYSSVADQKCCTTALDLNSVSTETSLSRPKADSNLL